MLYFFMISTILLPFLANVFFSEKRTNSVLSLMIFFGIAQISIFILPIGVFYSFLISIITFSLFGIFCFINILKKKKLILQREFLIPKIKQNIHILIFGILMIFLLIFGVFHENGFDTDNYLYLEISKHYETVFTSGSFVGFEHINNSPFINFSGVTTPWYQTVGLYMYQGFSYNLNDMINWSKVYIPFLLVFLSYLSGWKIVVHFFSKINYKTIILYNTFWTIVLLILLLSPFYYIFITLWSQSNLEMSFFAVILIFLGIMENRNNWYYFSILLFLAFLSSTFTIFCLFILLFLFFKNLFFKNKINEWIDFVFVGLFTASFLMPVLFNWIVTYAYAYSLLCLFAVYHFYFKKKWDLTKNIEWKWVSTLQGKCEFLTNDTTNKKNNFCMTVISFTLFCLSTIIYGDFLEYSEYLIWVTITTICFYALFFILVNTTNVATTLRKHFFLVNITMSIFFSIYLIMYLIGNITGNQIEGFESFWRIITFYPQQYNYSMPSTGLIINALIFLLLVIINFNKLMKKNYFSDISQRCHNVVDGKFKYFIAYKNSKIFISSALTLLYLSQNIFIVSYFSDKTAPYLRSNYLNVYASFHEISLLQNKMEKISDNMNSRLNIVSSMNPAWMFNNNFLDNYMTPFYNYRVNEYSVNNSVSPLVANKDPYNLVRVLGDIMYIYWHQETGIFLEDISILSNKNKYVQLLSFYDFLIVDNSQTEFLIYFTEITGFKKLNNVGGFNIYLNDRIPH